MQVFEKKVDAFMMVHGEWNGKEIYPIYVMQGWRWLGVFAFLFLGMIVICSAVLCLWLLFMIHDWHGDGIQCDRGISRELVMPQ